MSFKFTIIIPCYNAEPYIQECIDSAMSQTYQNKEIICVDNESTDNSLSIIKKMKEKHPELIIDSAPNIYKYSWEEPVEKALEKSTGKYFTILGADDIIEKDYIQNVVNIISTNPDKIKVMQSPIMGIQGSSKNKLGLIGHSYKSMEDFKSQLFDKCPVTTPSVGYSKELHDKKIIRWNSKEYLGAVDYDLYFNLADNNHFIYPFPKWLGYYYRWHSQQATWGMHEETTNYDKVIQDHWRKKWKHMKK